MIKVCGDGVEPLGQRRPRVHVLDMVCEAHADRLALCYPACNSSLGADRNSSLLDHPGVGTIKELKERRRKNLARLRDEVGANKLAELTELPAAMLYQMALGKGKNARNVNDDHARLIEEKANKPRGWLDLPHGETVSHLPAPRAPEWPFPFPKSDWLMLSDDVRKALISSISSLVAEAKKKVPPKKQRRAS